MRRLMAFMVGPVFLIMMFVLVLVLLSLVVNELRSSRPAVVHLKSNVNATGERRSGEVRRTDKFVIIKPDTGGAEEVYTWDQIHHIEETAPSTRQVDRIVDLIDLLSKLGIAATVIFFMIGLYQYGQTQKWEREKFLANSVKEFLEVKQNRNAMAMIDALALYEKGRMVELFPEEELAKNRKVFVENSKIYEALTTTPRDDLLSEDTVAITIRDCFDHFLSYMGVFHHYIEQELITQDALSAHLGYWIVLFGPKGSLSSSYKSRILAYADKYGMTEFEELIRKYNKRLVWERIVERVVR